MPGTALISKLDSSCSRMMCGGLAQAGSDRSAAGARRSAGSMASDSRKPRIDIVDDRGRARARELRHVVARRRIHRRDRSGSRTRGRRVPRSTPAAPSVATRRRTRNGSSRQISDQRRRAAGSPRCRPCAPRPGKIDMQERERVGVDDHQVDEVGGHQQDVVLEARQQDQADEQRERKRRRRRRAAQQRKPAEIRESPR